MENQNPTQQNVVPEGTSVQPPISPAPAEETHEAPINSPLDRIKFLLQNLKIKFDNANKQTKIIVIVVAVLFGIILLLSILVALFGKKQHVPILLPTPTPISASPAPNVILNASRYATDSGVLKIESDLNNFQKQLDTTDVKQSDLSVPNLDFNINFNQ